MIVYHYAKRSYKALKTRRAQRKLSRVEIMDEESAAEFRGDPAPYCDSISFFMQPLPLNLLGVLFEKHDHRIWKHGNTVFQHTVETKELGDFRYQFVETPFDIDFMNSNWPAHKHLSDEQKREYFHTRSQAKIRSGEIGKGNSQFETVAKKFDRDIALWFRDAIRTNTEEDMKRYATSVPHVMIYPPSGIAQLTRPATEETIDITKLPPSARW